MLYFVHVCLQTDHCIPGAKWDPHSTNSSTSMARGVAPLHSSSSNLQSGCRTMTLWTQQSKSDCSALKDRCAQTKSWLRLSLSFLEVSRSSSTRFSSPIMGGASCLPVLDARRCVQPSWVTTQHCLRAFGCFPLKRAFKCKVWQIGV